MAIYKQSLKYITQLKEKSKYTQYQTFTECTVIKIKIWPFGSGINDIFYSDLPNSMKNFSSIFHHGIVMYRNKSRVRVFT